jgi:uncharacterized phage infection (PIP) family protein YhgE
MALINQNLDNKSPFKAIKSSRNEIKRGKSFENNHILIEENETRIRNSKEFKTFEDKNENLPRLNQSLSSLEDRVKQIEGRPSSRQQPNSQNEYMQIFEGLIDTAIKQ